MKTDRRTFLKQSGSMLTASTLGSLGALGATSLWSDPAWASELADRQKRDGKPTLVVLYLRGGADPLNTIVPYRDPLYYQVRPTIAIPPQDYGGVSGVIPLDDVFGLHPALSPMTDLFTRGWVAPVVNVGSPHETRSHFDAQDFMERAAPGIRSITEGWLNRYLQATATEADPELRALAPQPLLPKSLRGMYPVLAAPGAGSEAAMATFEPFYGASEDADLIASQRERVRQAELRLQERQASRDQLSRHRRRGMAEGSMRSGEHNRLDIVEAGSNTIRRLRELHRITSAGVNADVDYPRHPLGGQLRDIAQVIKANVGLEIAAVDYNGWDHHAYQGGVEGAMADMLGHVARSVAAFYQDLGQQGERTLLLMMSEFGRTVAENGNNGSDHGRGGFMLAVGGMVNGRRVYGRWTGLDSAQLVDGRDLPVHTDFRVVMAEALYRLFRFDPTSREAAGFFPDWLPRSAPLGLLKDVKA